MTKKVFNLETGETTIVELTAEEVAAKEAFIRDVRPLLLMSNLRGERNARLAETDYLALADSTLTDEMRAYRQALRDLPANTPDPANVVWPTKPN